MGRDCLEPILEPILVPAALFSDDDLRVFYLCHYWGKLLSALDNAFPSVIPKSWICLDDSHVVEQYLNLEFHDTCLQEIACVLQNV